ncbi:MAG: hypothetical protein AB8B72_09425 [Crocinitomicaceae bacterium]
MRLEEIHFVNLKLISDSIDQCLSKDDFKSKESYPEKDKKIVIEDLLFCDLIETENDPNLYFLTTEGYYAVEQGWSSEDYDNDFDFEEEIIVDNNELEKNGKFLAFTLSDTWKILFAIAFGYTVNIGYQKFFGAKDANKYGFKIIKEHLEDFKNKSGSTIIITDSILKRYNLLKDQGLGFQDSVD